MMQESGIQNSLTLNHLCLSKETRSEDYASNVERLHKHAHAIRKLLMGWNHNREILSLIYEMKFANLSLLTLSGNDLESMELLSRVYLPQLRHIELRENPIPCTKSLRKCMWPRLTSLHLPQSPNYSQQFSLFFSHSHFPTLKVIILHTQSYDGRSLLKSSFDLKIVLGYGESRPPFASLQRRYPSMLFDPAIQQFLPDSAY